MIYKQIPNTPYFRPQKKEKKHENKYSSDWIGLFTKKFRCDMPMNSVVQLKSVATSKMPENGRAA